MADDNGSFRTFTPSEWRYAFIHTASLVRSFTFARSLTSYSSCFNGPDGRQYYWGSSATGECIVCQQFLANGRRLTSLLFQLYNDAQQRVAFFRPVRPTRYPLGDVYGELHFCSGQNTGTPVSQRACLLPRVLPFSRLTPFRVFGIDASAINGYDMSDSNGLSSSCPMGLVERCTRQVQALLFDSERLVPSCLSSTL